MVEDRTANRTLYRSAKQLLMVIVLFLALDLSAAAQSVSFPLLEDYLPSGKMSQYVDAASQYLRAHPESRFAPRVAFDLLMVSEGTSNQTMADSMRAFLLFEHAGSLQTFHVVSGFKEAKDLREFLKNQTEVRLHEKPASLPQQFTRAVAVGLDHFKEKLLEDGDFLLQAYSMADFAEAERIRQIILPVLRRECEANEDLAFVFNILQDKRLNSVEKIIRLHGRRDEPAFLELFYLTRLTSEQKRLPPILKIGAENAIRSKEYSEAQRLIGSMPHDMQNDPQILFWKGWSLFGLRKDRQALEAFVRLSKIHPDSKWASAAGIFSDSLRNFAVYRQSNVEAILAAVKVFQQGVGVLEATFRFNRETESGTKETYTVYVGLVPEENYLEFSIARVGRLFLGYRTTDTDSALFLESEPKILVFRERGLIPTPSLSLKRNNDGTFIFHAGVEMASSIQQAAAGSAGLLHSPYLSTPEGIQDLLDYVARRQGWIPAKSLSTAGDHIFVWKIPHTGNSAMQQVEYHISRHHLITSVKSEHWSIRDIRYAPAKSFRLQAPSWPDHPVSVSQGFDFAALFKVFGSAMSLVMGKP